MTANRKIASLTPTIFSRGTIDSTRTTLKTCYFRRARSSDLMRFRAISTCFVIITCLNYGIGGAKPQQVSSDQGYSRFEEFEKSLSEHQVRDRLDAFAQHLKLNPSLRALMMSYGGMRSCQKEAYLRARLATDYLSKVKGIPPHRVRILNGGYRDDWVVQLWVGSPGAAPPSSLRTIDKRRVTIRKHCRFTTMKVSE